MNDSPCAGVERACGLMVRTKGLPVWDVESDSYLT